MAITVGQQFHVLQGFDSPEKDGSGNGIPKSRYMEGHTYTVTPENLDYIEAAIEEGNAAPGAGLPREGNKLGADSAKLTGNIDVKR